jgi:hypothetical protein
MEEGDKGISAGWRVSLEITSSRRSSPFGKHKKR